METLITYLLKSAALMTAFFLAYHCLLRNETFFSSNRWYLLAGLITSVVLPLVTFEKTVWVTRDPQQIIHYGQSVLESNSASLDRIPKYEIDWILVVLTLYAIGALYFLVRFAIDLYAVHRILHRKPVKRDEGCSLVDLDENLSPFSFFRYIVFNSGLYSDRELRNILEHEKVHCRQLHTTDVLVARLFCIVFWWNPLVWLHKNAILQNLEFIADCEATKNLSDKRSYQITLLKITANQNCVSISNHFFQSLIKKRIVMLNKNRSKISNAWKYGLIIPALAAFILYFQVRVVAQETPVQHVRTVADPVVEVVVTKNATNDFLNAEAKRMEQHGIKLKFSGIKRNKNSEITSIKISYAYKDGQKGKAEFQGNEPIEVFRIFVEPDKNGKNAIGIGRLGVNDRYADAATAEFDRANGAAKRNSVEAPEPPSPPEVPELSEVPTVPPMPQTAFIDIPDGPSNVQTIVDKNGNTKVIINGKVVAEVNPDKILADMDPIFIDGVDVLGTGKPGNASSVRIETRKITREALADAKRAMERARPQIERARRDADRAGTDVRRQVIRERTRESESGTAEELRQQKIDLEQAKRDLEQSRRDIEQAKRDLEHSKRDFEQSKKEFQESKK